MAAALMRQEELTITLELAILKPDLMSVVIAVKCKFESAEVKAVRALGVALRLFPFSDHPIVHPLSPFIGEIKRHARWRMPQMI
jgi:hypothetical protein